MAIPDTPTGWGLAEVISEVSPATSDLVACFAAADPAQFDPAYEGSKNSLLNFRNYGNQGVPTQAIALSYNSQSGSNACALFPSTNYYIPFGETFSSTTVIYSDSAGTTFAADGYYSDSSIYRHWVAPDFILTSSC